MDFSPLWFEIITVINIEMAVPLGKVEIDGSRCTGCGLCALECPTGALATSHGEDDGYQLLFRHGSCVACGQCVEICPEECLHLERTLELDRINQPAKVLFEDRIARCSQCSNPIGTEAMIDKLSGQSSFTLGTSFWPVSHTSRPISPGSGYFCRRHPFALEGSLSGS